MEIYKLIIIMVLFTSNSPPTVFFEYKSEGTMSHRDIHVVVKTDYTVYYKRTHKALDYIEEEWTGKLDPADYKVFVDKMIGSCKFMELPLQIEEQVMIKDVSTDWMCLNYNSKKHSIGGYGASHYKKYKCVYDEYNNMLFKVQNFLYMVKPK
jgi:hypothetical protein